MLPYVHVLDLRCQATKTPRNLVPGSDMLAELDVHGHISVVLKCILHALIYLRISDSLSLGYIEHFHKVWLMYAECASNVTRAPSVGRS